MYEGCRRKTGTFYMDFFCVKLPLYCYYFVHNKTIINEYHRYISMILYVVSHHFNGNM